MIDFVEAIKSQCEYTPNFSHCQKYSSGLNNYGYDTYMLQGNRSIKLNWHPENHILKIAGSLPYFLKGHNISYSREEFIETIEQLQTWLNIPLWDAIINTLEYGVIFPVEQKPTLYIKNHTAPLPAHLYQNEKGKDKGKFRWWDNGIIALKMYDAGKNLKEKVGRRIIEDAGLNPEMHYLKFEMHHKKPFLLNRGQDITLESLLDQSLILSLKHSLIENYHLLQPMKTLVRPSDKKDLSALDLVLNIYVEALINQGIPIEEAKKRIYAFINQQEALTKPDKDSRKATIRKAFSKLQQSVQSQWDLTPRIEEALEMED